MLAELIILMPIFFPLLLQLTKKKFPGISFQLIEAGSWELIDMLKNDKIDLTFNCTPNPSDKLRRFSFLSGYDPV